MQPIMEGARQKERRTLTKEMVGCFWTLDLLYVSAGIQHSMACTSGAEAHSCRYQLDPSELQVQRMRAETRLPLQPSQQPPKCLHTRPEQKSS